jgi:hypothetical protein
MFPGTKVFVPDEVKKVELGADEILVSDDRGVGLVSSSDENDH